MYSLKNFFFFFFCCLLLHHSLKNLRKGIKAKYYCAAVSKHSIRLVIPIFHSFTYPSNCLPSCNMISLGFLVTLFKFKCLQCLFVVAEFRPFVFLVVFGGTFSVHFCALLFMIIAMICHLYSFCKLTLTY